MDTANYSELEIYRESHHYGKLRAYSILVDGIKVGTVKNGETALINVTPGTHNIVIKLDWTKSNTITINTETGKTIKLKIGYEKLNGWKLYSMTGGWIAAAIIGAIFGIGILVGLGVAGFMLNRVGKMHLYQTA